MANIVLRNDGSINVTVRMGMDRTRIPRLDTILHKNKRANDAATKELFEWRENMLKWREDLKTNVRNASKDAEEVEDVGRKGSSV